MHIYIYLNETISACGKEQSKRIEKLAMSSSTGLNIHALIVNPNLGKERTQQRRTRTVTIFAAKSGSGSGSGFSLNSILGKCETCSDKGAVDCKGCKGTGRNKKNGNIFERWKCFDCQGFGMRECPECGKGGLTPEQRGER